MSLTITGNDDVYKYVKANKGKITINRESFNSYENTVYNATFTDVTFTNELKSIRFSNCRFLNCSFKGVFGFYWILRKCKFTDCNFYNSRISHIYYSWEEVEFKKCQFLNVKIDESGFGNIFFIECYFSSFSLIDFNPLWNVHFIGSYIENSQFESLIYYKAKKEMELDIPDMVFDNCEVITTVFILTDLRNSYFTDSTLYKTGFIDCALGSKTLSTKTRHMKNSHASIDTSTILRSEKLPIRVLEHYFGITDSNVKKTVADISAKNEYASVFISYSVQDEKFASILNRELNEVGVNTFLWSKDAPAGERLKNIMTHNIMRYDMMLFIASAKSIYSEPCHYELLECRQKQQRYETELLIPVHLDDTLFEVCRENFKHMANSEECWNSILELKQINSLSFVRYANAQRTSHGLRLELDKVLLRIKRK